MSVLITATCPFTRFAYQTKRGELEITSLLETYMSGRKLDVINLGRGTSWFDAGVPGSLLSAGNFISLIQSKQNQLIACLEEIALSKGWISKFHVANAISLMHGSNYANYLSELIKE